MGTSQGKLQVTADSVEVVENNITDNHSIFSLLSCDFHSKMGASLVSILVVGIMILVWHKCCGGLWGMCCRWPNWTGRQDEGTKGLDRDTDMKMDMDMDRKSTASRVGTGSFGHCSMQTLSSSELFKHPANPYLGSYGMMCTSCNTITGRQTGGRGSGMDWCPDPGVLQGWL